MDKPYKEQLRKIELTFNEIIFRTNNKCFRVEQIGKTIFFTQSEAEQALMKMKESEDKDE